MTTDKSWVRILIYNDCGTEKFLNVFFPLFLLIIKQIVNLSSNVVNQPEARVAISVDRLSQ